MTARPSGAFTQVDLQAQLHKYDWDNTMLTNTGPFPPPPELPHYKYPAHTAPLPRGKGVLQVAKFRKDDPTIMDEGKSKAKAVRVLKVELGDVALRPPPRDAEHEAVYLVRLVGQAS